ncbi:MAG TPA: hypothetical protein VMK12_22170 [Anaeromyxobacteraceae bacterium]|nr:hypothetical protein [Anaeromyxobacteraceae bacterium]
MVRNAAIFLVLGAIGSARAQSVVLAEAPAPSVQAEEPSKPPPTPQADSPAKKTPVVGKWTTDLYGFIEFDGIEDSTQSFNDLAGNQFILRSDTYGGEHRRTTGSVRNTRLGFKMVSPDFHGMHGTALLEADFLGNQPVIGVSTGQTSESGFFTSPDFRVRHAWLKLETPYVDVLMGQNWQLFGWQPYFHPNTVEIQGAPGQVYSRTPQVRLSHMFKADPLGVEVAAAAMRPAQRDSGSPDWQGGLRLLEYGWKGVHTLGAASTIVEAAAVGVSGVYRNFRVGTLGNANNVAKAGNVDHNATSWGMSVDGFIPVIPSAGSRGNALSLIGSFVRGDGIADMYSGLSFGLPAIQAGDYIDSGLATVDAANGLHAVSMRSWLLGLQYYFPGSGNVWFSGNYSRVDFLNANDSVPALSAPNTLVGKSAVFMKSEWFDFNIFWDVIPAIRFGFEYARFRQTDVDGFTAQNNRFQLSGFFIF